MSDQSARHASFFSVIAVFIGIGLFVIVLRYAYHPPTATRPYNVAGEKLPEDQVWMATPEGRKAHLVEVREAQMKQQAAPAGWIDKGKGVVHLPIDKAMQLTAQEKKSGVRK